MTRYSSPQPRLGQRATDGRAEGRTDRQEKCGLLSPSPENLPAAFASRRDKQYLAGPPLSHLGPLSVLPLSCLLLRTVLGRKRSTFRIEFKIEFELVHSPENLQPGLLSIERTSRIGHSTVDFLHHGVMMPDAATVQWQQSSNICQTQAEARSAAAAAARSVAFLRSL